MPSPNNESPKKLVFNDALLKAFIDGGLEPSIEQKVAAYLEARPELLAKITSHSGDVFLNRLKIAKQQSIAAHSNEVAVTQNGAAVDAKLLPSSASSSSNTPIALANYAGYQVTKELGRGGMGVVYLAKNVQMDRLEVLKVLNERLLDHEGAKERFLREVRAVSRLNHPNIVTSYSILPLDRLMVFAMEYVHGMDLHKFIHKHKPLPIGLACSFARQLALGLQHAHEKGLVHRDIKPSNAIVYKADGQLQLKILDFGLAKASSEKKSDGLTQDGTMLGTPEYMSPEQTLNASKADIRADIYSLGCTLYTMLTSSPPFTGTHGEIMMAHAQREAATVNLRRPEVPTELAAIVAKMMAKDVAKRFQVPSEVAAALQPFLGKNYGVSKEQPAAPLEASGTVNDLKAPDRETSVEKQRDLSLDYMSVESEKPALTFEEMLKRPKPAATLLRGTKRQTKSRRSKNGWMFAIVANLILLPLTLWMAGVFSVKTPDGTIVFDKLPKDADVFVDGKEVQVTWNEGKDKAMVSVKQGNRMVKVVSGDVTVLGENVVIEPNEASILKVKLVNGIPSQVSNQVDVGRLSTGKPRNQNSKVPHNMDPKGPLLQLPRGPLHGVSILEADEWIVTKEIGVTTTNEGFLKILEPETILKTKRTDLGECDVKFTLTAEKGTVAYVCAGLGGKRTITSSIIDAGDAIYVGHQSDDFDSRELGTGKKTVSYDETFELRLKVKADSTRIAINGSWVSGVAWAPAPLDGAVGIVLTKGSLTVQSIKVIR